MSHSKHDGLFIETGRFVAHPWHCDANGHLNSRYYLGFFDDANQHLFAHCGHGGVQTGRSIVDLHCSINFKAEVLCGSLVVVQSRFKALGNRSFTSYQEMRSTDGLSLFATCETVSVFFDLSSRTSSSMCEDFRSKALELLVKPQSDDK